MTHADRASYEYTAFPGMEIQWTFPLVRVNYSIDSVYKTAAGKLNPFDCVECKALIYRSLCVEKLRILWGRAIIISICIFIVMCKKRTPGLILLYLGTYMYLYLSVKCDNLKTHKCSNLERNSRLNDTGISSIHVSIQFIHVYQ